MVREDTFFYLSGALSLLIFFIITSLFIFMGFYSSSSSSYALTKDDYISVSLDLVASAPQQKEIDKTIEVPDLKTEVDDSMTLQETQEDSFDTDIQIDDLFSDVWTKDISKKKVPEKKVDNKRYQEIAKKTKSAKDVEKKKLASQLPLASSAGESNTNTSRSSGDEVNEYLAKIHALVYQHFDPPTNSQGHSVKAVIELSARGKVQDFRILNYSANILLNEESDRVKNRLLKVLFPVSPDGKNERLIIILRPEE